MHCSCPMNSASGAEWHMLSKLGRCFAWLIIGYELDFIVDGNGEDQKQVNYSLYENDLTRDLFEFYVGKLF